MEDETIEETLPDDQDQVTEDQTKDQTVDENGKKKKFKRTKDANDLSHPKNPYIRTRKAILKKKNSALLSPAKKFFTKGRILLICLFVVIVAGFVYAFVSTIPAVDKRPIANEFETATVLPERPDVVRGDDSKIILEPVNNNELIFAENKLEQTIEKKMDSLGMTEQVSQIKSITRYNMVDKTFEKQRDIFEVVVSNAKGQTFAVQYLDEYNKDTRVDPINYSNETKTLTSLTKLLKKLPIYDVVTLDETRSSSQYTFIQRNGSETNRFIQYNKNFSSVNVYQENEDEDFEIIESLKPEEKIMSAYKKSIDEIAKITEFDYDAIMSDYNQTNYIKDYTFKK